MKKTILYLLIAVLSLAFVKKPAGNGDDEQSIPLPISKQRSGNAAKGYGYLITGDYLKSGVPYAIFLLANGKDTTNFLHRDALNKNLSHEYTAVKAPNGEIVVAPNCLQCHARVFDGQLIVGLGNSQIDFTVNRQGTAIMLENFLKNSPSKLEAARNFITSIKTVSPDLIAKTRGVNLADMLAFLLVAHRDPQTFAWSDANLLPLPAEAIPSDVPAWWLLKKKNAMFYNGFGRGDFGRFLMASNLLTVTDTAEAAAADRHFNDVLAYINSIQAPKYPKSVDAKLVTQGKTIFNTSCSSCHGTYGPNGKYPNLLIPESVIQTDSLLYSSNYSSPQFVNWFNKSWFATGDDPAALVPYRGYIAPPLDGIWVTAPYLHNGSVPDLECLLNSKKRPVCFQRMFPDTGYRYDIPGWKYKVSDTAAGSAHSDGDNELYDTRVRGYGNGGHYFGDVLSDKDRRAVIEYLKTL